MAKRHHETTAKPLTVVPLPVEQPVPEAWTPPSVEAPGQPAVFKEQRYRVKNRRVVSLWGQMNTFYPGQLLSNVTHGTEGVRRLQEAGVELELID